MKNLCRRAAASLLCAATLCGAFMIPTAVDAAVTLRDDDWEIVGKTPAYNSCGSTQGMAVSDQYAYSAQVNGNNTTCTIMRVSLETGKTTIMKDGSDKGRAYFRNMAHANDMDWARIDGVEYLFVISESTMLVYEIRDNVLALSSEYKIRSNGAAFIPGSFGIRSITEEKITFLFKSGIYISEASIQTGAKSGNLNATAICTLDYTGFELDGKSCDYSSFLNQAMFVKDDFLFVVKAGCEKEETMHQSIILGYDLKGAKGTIKPRADMVFFLQSDKNYRGLLEAEDCAIGVDGKLYFNGNARRSAYDTDHDAVWRLKDYTFSASRDAIPTFTVKYKANRGIGSLLQRTVLLGDPVSNESTNINRKGYAFVGWTAERASDSTVFCVNKTDTADRKWLTEAEMGDTYIPYMYGMDEVATDLTDVSGDTVTFAAQWHMYADATGDEKLTIADALAIRLYAAGYYHIDEAELPYMDVNSDGVVNIADAQVIIAYLADVVYKIPTE